MGGDNGFVKFTRNYHNCHLWNYSSYPRLDTTGASDNGGNDSATDYRAGDNDDAEPVTTATKALATSAGAEPSGLLRTTVRELVTAALVPAVQLGALTDSANTSTCVSK